RRAAAADRDHGRGTPGLSRPRRPGRCRRGAGSRRPAGRHRAVPGRADAAVTSLVDKLLDVPAWVVYVVTFALVFAEDALFVGFVLPGETAAILAGVAASQGNAN